MGDQDADPLAAFLPAKDAPMGARYTAARGSSVIQDARERSCKAREAASFEREAVATRRENTVRLREDVAQLREEVAASREANARKRRHVLLVDDDTDTLGMLAMWLQMAGHHVSTALDGLSALERIDTEAPDVVVCDIGLPGIDGYTVAERVRKRIGHHRPILIALTGYGQTDDRYRAFRAGFDHYFVKPSDLRKLDRAICEG